MQFETKLSPYLDSPNHPKYKTNFPLSQLPKSVVAVSGSHFIQKKELKLTLEKMLTSLDNLYSF
jgi:hypothetical protein